MHNRRSKEYVGSLEINVYVYGHTYSKNMDQPGKVASPARGQLNRKKEYYTVLTRVVTVDDVRT